LASSRQFALGRFELRIRHVTVDLADVNGPHGGVDKSCRIAVHLNWGRTLRMGLIGAELIPLVDCAADHIGQAIRRALQRWRDQRRQRPPRNGNITEVDYTA
jgi:hypothetical protein